MLTQGVWVELEMKCVFSELHGKETIDKSIKLSETYFSMECSIAEFLDFLA